MPQEENNMTEIDANVFNRRRRGLSNKTAEEILLTIFDAESSDISGSEDENDVGDAYNVDTEEYGVPRTCIDHP
ncbi:hypothetical protein HPB48_007935 [Haemaphysalis longicornis]|uniref:Uncharacterized protein n=1 Tax=Haemaphysalis longicornis TaxID=44386 RepID=A0A9J6FA43_HAELO|nr:hypothetical protein HPB48_007935 [Haemaphysalis longicornis]